MKLKTIVISVMLLIFIIILFQNLEVVPFQLLFWKFEIARIVLFPATLLVGVVIGYILTITKKKKIAKDDSRVTEK